MPVYKEKIKSKVKYFARINYTDLNGKYKTKKSRRFDTKREAEIEEIKLKQELAIDSKNERTFDELFIEFEQQQKDKVKYNTFRTYHVLYNHATKHLGNLTIKELTVQKYKLFQAEINKDGRLNLYNKNRLHKLIKRLIRYSSLMYGVGSNIPDKVGGFYDPDFIKKEMNFFTHDEFKKFIDQFENQLIMKCLFLTLYYQGLRIGEANALTWDDIDFNRKEMKINKSVSLKIKGTNHYISAPKTKNGNRIIPIESGVLNALKFLKMKYEFADGFSNNWFVFGGFRPLSETNITNLKNKACKNANVKQIRIHDFRHSCASYYINLGVPTLTISRFLGHASTSFTLDTYGHLYPNSMAEMMKLSDNFKD